MHMQLYLQLAEINAKVKAARTLLAAVEKRQAALQHLLPQSKTAQQSRNHQMAAQPVAHEMEVSGDGYLEGLIGLGRWEQKYPMYR